MGFDYIDLAEDEGEYDDEEYFEEYSEPFDDPFAGTNYHFVQLDESNSARLNFDLVVRNCIAPILGDPNGFQRCLEVPLACLLLRFTIAFSTMLPRSVPNLTTIAIGVALLYRHFQADAFLIVLPAIVSLALITVLRSRPRNAKIATVVLFAGYYLFLELVWLSATAFTRLRGALMILTMKQISLAFDLTADGDDVIRRNGNGANKEVKIDNRKSKTNSVDNGNLKTSKLDNDEPIDEPSLLECLSYSLCTSSVIYGPWFPLSVHRAMMHPRPGAPSLFLTIVKGAVLSAMSVCCLLYSTCFVHWFFASFSSRWALGFRDAQSFRFSHYFISFLGEAGALFAGAQLAADLSFDSDTTRPFEVELPRSLVTVVTSWNIPMHRFLRRYVFDVCRRELHVGAFSAVFITYAVSAGLHGLNFQLAAVLFSLGVYTYAEHELREKVARAFDACVRSRRCPTEDGGCGHRYGRWHPATLLANGAFSALAIFHLLYLGVVFNDGGEQERGYSMQHTLRLWGAFGYSSHILGGVLFLVAKSV